MSQNDYTIANQGFPAFRADLNSALQAIATNNSGDTEPSTMFANMWWYDSANNILYIRNEDNDAWIKFAELDQTNDKFVLSGTLQLDDGTVSAPALTFNSDTNMGLYRGGTDILKFVTAGTDAITIDASQNTNFAGTLGVTSDTTIGTGAASTYVGLVVNGGTDANLGPTIYLNKGGTSFGVLSNYGRIQGGTSSDFFITTTTTNNLILGTNNTERMRIESGGRVGINNNNPNSAMLHVDQTVSNEQGIFVNLEHASYANLGVLISSVRAGSSAFSILSGKVSNGGDQIFNLRGDGNAYADNNWNAGGADYAEYFEWKDGNSSSEDRRGYTVVLDGNQIRKSTSDDAQSSIIGVVSATPTMVGDNAWDKWSGKYEKDEWGSYILEEYTQTEWSVYDDEERNEKLHSYQTDKIPSDVTVPSDAIVTSTETDGSTKLMRRKESSSYDASKTYVPREDRVEWDTIGLVGKLRIRVGQNVGDRWIKMREISDTVHEYLVR